MDGTIAIKGDQIYYRGEMVAKLLVDECLPTVISDFRFAFEQFLNSAYNNDLYRGV
jgi:hypothetical protein